MYEYRAPTTEEKCTGPHPLAHLLYSQVVSSHAEVRRNGSERREIEHA